MPAFWIQFSDDLNRPSGTEYEVKRDGIFSKSVTIH